MVLSEQGQQCRGLGGAGQREGTKVSTRLQTERRQQKRESLLLGAKTGFDIEVVFRKCNPRLGQSSLPTTPVPSLSSLHECRH